MVGNGLKQNNLNVSLNTQLFKFLTFEYRTRLLHKEVDGSGTDGVSLLDALRQAPTEGLDEYMKLPEDDTYYDPDLLDEITRFNPKEESEKNYKKRINKSLNTIGALTWNIMKGMTFRTEFGFENNAEESRRFGALIHLTPRIIITSQWLSGVCLKVPNGNYPMCLTTTLCWMIRMISN